MRFIILLALIITLAACQSQKKPLGLTPQEKETIIKKVKENLVFVEGGTFMMGDVGYTDENGINRPFSGDPDAFPVHQVTLDSYYMQKYEVCYGDFDLFTKAVGKDSIYAEFIGDDIRQPNLPAKGMTWYEAQEYCEWLGELSGIPMSLPTEAQWEYAARSRGKAVASATDNGKIEQPRNYFGDPNQQFGAYVGSFPPNPLGLHDMSGSVAEWTLDFYKPYTKEALVNPVCIDSTYPSLKVARGFAGPSGNIYRRAERKPTNTGSGVGLRCVVNVKQDTIK